MANYQGMAAAISEAFDKMLDVVNASKQSVMNVMGDLEELATSKKTTLVEAINELNKTKVSKKVEDRVEIDYIHTVITTDKFLRVDGGVVPTYKLEQPRNMYSGTTINKPLLRSTDGNLKEINISSMITASTVGTSDSLVRNKVAPLEEWVVVEDSNGILVNPPLRINVLYNSANVVGCEIFLRVDPSKRKGSVIKLKTTNWEGPELVVNVLHEAEFDVQKYLDELVISSSLHPYKRYPVLGNPDNYMNGAVLDSITLKGHYRLSSGDLSDMNVYSNFGQVWIQPNDDRSIKPYTIHKTNVTVDSLGIHPADNELISSQFFSVDEIIIVYNGKTYRRVYQENLDKYARNKERLQRYLSTTRVEATETHLRLVSDYPNEELKNDPIIIDKIHNLDPWRMLMENGFSTVFDSNQDNISYYGSHQREIRSNVLVSHDIAGAVNFAYNGGGDLNILTKIDSFKVEFMGETFDVVGGTVDNIDKIVGDIRNKALVDNFKRTFYLTASGVTAQISEVGMYYNYPGYYDVSSIPSTIVFEVDELNSEVKVSDLIYAGYMGTLGVLDVDKNTITVTNADLGGGQTDFNLPVYVGEEQVNKTLRFKKITVNAMETSIVFDNPTSWTFVG